jgi:hypothetical protein
MESLRTAFEEEVISERVKCDFTKLVCVVVL